MATPAKATAWSPSNLAFVKYWGKRDPTLNIPANSSISMTLDSAYTVTTVEYDAGLPGDVLLYGETLATVRETERVSHYLDRVRRMAGIEERARITTRNSFPKGSGIASSASGFAALALAATAAAGLHLSERELSILARQGSGSACRSIPAGFVEWIAGDDDQSSYAVQIAPPDHWDLCDVIAIVSTQSKDITSSDAHLLAPESPFFAARQQALPETLREVRAAILARDMLRFGLAVEREAVSMHAVAMTSPPPVDMPWASGVYYWQPATLALILAVQSWRKQGLPVFFTIDAGPNVHVLCEGRHAPMASRLLHERPEVYDVIVSRPCEGAHLVMSKK